QTFRPKKKFAHGTLRYSLHKQAQASLNSGINLRSVVKLPPGEDMNDWIAVHVVDFFNRINLIYGTVSEYCDSASCPTMSGGARFEYLWADGEKYKKPTALPAPQYVTLLMDWIEAQINNETVFPVSTDVPFPKTFVPLCRKILTRLFRVFVHVYIHHFDRIVAIGAYCGSEKTDRRFGDPHDFGFVFRKFPIFIFLGVGEISRTATSLMATKSKMQSLYDE
ncbi:Mps one binder kinase activator-like 3, partial [Acromyrmex echinatior]